MTEIKIQDFESYGNWINNQDENAGNVESINVSIAIPKIFFIMNKY